MVEGASCVTSAVFSDILACSSCSVGLSLIASVNNAPAPATVCTLWFSFACAVKPVRLLPVKIRVPAIAIAKNRFIF